MTNYWVIIISWTNFTKQVSIKNFAQTIKIVSGNCPKLRDILISSEFFFNCRDDGLNVITVRNSARKLPHLINSAGSIIHHNSWFFLPGTMTNAAPVPPLPAPLKSPGSLLQLSLSLHRVWKSHGAVWGWFNKYSMVNVEFNQGWS